MRAKRYPFRGLDLRSNIMNRSPGSAWKSENFRLDSNRNLIKREELVSKNIPREITATPANFSTALPPLDLGFNTKIIDFFEFEEDHFFIIIKVEDPGNPGDFYNKFYKYIPSSNTLTEILPNSGGVSYGAMGYVPSSDFGLVSNICQTQIIDGSLYFISSLGIDSEPEEIYKYDGYTVYRAGLAGEIFYGADAGTLGGSNWYVRDVYFYVDGQGYFHQLWGSTTQRTYSITLTRDLQTATDLRFNVASFVADSGITTDFTSGAVTISADPTALKVFPGQWVCRITNLTGTPRVFRFKVTSTTASSVDVDQRQELISGVWTDVDTSESFSVSNGDWFCNTFIASYRSRIYNTGYTFNKINPYPVEAGLFTSYVLDNTDHTIPENLPLATNFEDGINEGLIRVNPPRGKSLAFYDGSLLVIDNFNLYFSDISIGGSVETFAAFDNFTVGSEKFGPLTGVFANEEYIVLMREFQSYYITGNIFTGNFRAQNYDKTQIGCSSPTGIALLDGVCIFPSFRGFYVAGQGAQMQEISDNLEPMFVEDSLGYNLDMSKVKAEVDPWREYILFYIPSLTPGDNGSIVLYSYYFQEWFVYRNVNSIGGLLIARDRKLYSSDGDELYVESDSYSSGVDAKFYSNYDDLGEPSLQKRFKKISIICPFLGDNDLTFKSFKDWSESNIVTDEIFNNALEAPVNSKRLNPTLAYSMSLGLESLGIESCNISGYEYSLEAEQTGITDASTD